MNTEVLTNQIARVIERLNSFHIEDPEMLGITRTLHRLITQLHGL